MTPREFELYAEGRGVEREWILDLFAWVQVNLINVHVPRGKPRVTINKIRPKTKKKKSEKEIEEEFQANRQALKEKLGKVGTKPKAASAEDTVDMWTAQARIKAKRREEEALKEDEEAFWNSPEGQELSQLVWGDSIPDLDEEA